VFCPVCRSDYPQDWKRCPKDEAVLLRAAVIGKYRVDGLLGVGGMGAVYRATNPDTKARVAIKVMNSSIADMDDARARFSREAAAVAALRTAYVASIYDFGSEPDGTMFLVMELLEGHGLRSEIATGDDAIPLSRFAMILDGALRGLSAAHRAGIVHRDLKPENIFIAHNDDGEVPKLLDFGIARVKTRESDLTHSGAIMGTPSYMAPEQVNGARGQIGTWSDVYAMGVIAYEMLSGVSPFAGDTMSEILMRIVDRQFAPLPTLRPSLPPQLYDLVDRCLMTEPEQRPANAEALRDLLRATGLVPAGGATVPAFTGRSKAVGNRANSSGDAATMDAAGTAPTVTPASLPRPSAIAAVGPTVAVDHSSSQRLQSAASSQPLVPTNNAIPTTEAKSRAALYVGIGLVTVAAAAAAFVMWPRGSSAVSADAAVVVVVQPIDAAQTIAVDSPTTPAELPAVLAAMPVDDWRRNWQVIPAGTYRIGQARISDAPYLAQATVELKSFAIMPYEMTRQRYALALGLADDAALPFNEDADSAAIRGVTAKQSEAACAALGATLPTEQQWEVAALTTPNDAKRAALLHQNELTTDCSSDGLCNMLGSLAEWTSSTWPGANGARVVRGGSVGVAANAGWYASIHARAKLAATVSDAEVGFRCVIHLEP
jgi:eukaryotic-like serine/threonine-protein kinase